MKNNPYINCFAKNGFPSALNLILVYSQGFNKINKTLYFLSYSNPNRRFDSINFLILRSLIMKTIHGIKIIVSDWMWLIIFLI